MNTKYTPEQIREAFWRKVNKTEACWIWTGSANEKGYGQVWRGNFTDKRTMQNAHRFSYEILVGPIPEGLELDHLCKNRLCVNPTHLEPVTHKENLARGNTLGAINSKKTHCSRGHELSQENILKRSRGGRECKICHRERVLANYHKLKAVE